MEMFCKLLGNRFREESITASVEDLIRGMEGGNAAHRTGALKLALRNDHSRGGGPEYPLKNTQNCEAVLVEEMDEISRFLASVF